MLFAAMTLSPSIILPGRSRRLHDWEFYGMAEGAFKSTGLIEGLSTTMLNHTIYLY